jgi:hypothetical protein
MNAIDLCKSKEAKSRISETHSHVRELIIHGQTDIDYCYVDQIVTFCPDLRKLVLFPINPAIQNDAIEIAFGKCRLKSDIACKLGVERFSLCSFRYSKLWQFCTKAIIPESSKTGQDPIAKCFNFGQPLPMVSSVLRKIRTLSDRQSL